MDSYEIEIFINSDKDSDDIVHIIPPESIIRVDLTESVITLLPKLELSFADGGIILDNNPITDKDVVHIRMNNAFDLPETEIVATFIISSINTSSVVQNSGTVITLTGYMACNNMFIPHKKVSYSGSSDTVLKKVVKSVGLKFNSNVSGSETNYWYQNGNNYSFLNHVADRSYVPNDGVFIYGGLDGVINYMSYKNVLSTDIIHKAIYGKDKMLDDNIYDDDDGKMYYDDYEVLNNTELYNNISNYGGSWSHYNLDGYIDSDINIKDSLTDITNRKDEYTEDPVFSVGVGIIAEKDLRNTIYRGRVQNNFAKFHLFSNCISINIRDITPVKLFDKVDLQLESIADPNEIMEPYSGEYMIASISHAIVKNSNPGYTKRVLLCRNGMNKSVVRENYDGIV